MGLIVLTKISSCSNKLSKEGQTYYLYENGTYNKDIFIF